MPAFTKSIAIDRRPEQVFAVLDDLQAAKEWMPAIRRIDVLTPGMRMGVGFKWRETRRIFGIFRMSVKLTVVQHDPPRTWGLMFNDGKVQATATFELMPKGHGTKVVFTEDVEDLQGKPARAERMVRMMEKQDSDLLERLKGRVEGSTGPPTGAAHVERTEAEPAPSRTSTRPASSKAASRASKTVKAKARAATKKATKAKKAAKNR